MIIIYLKQAWALLKQNKLFSALYIIGTGLAIGTTMIMAMVYYVKIAPAYPEVNRMHTYYLTSAQFEMGDNFDSTVSGSVSYNAVQEWFYPLKNVEAVSARLVTFESMNSYIQPTDGSGDIKVSLMLTDPAFFRIYAFQFLEGKSFTDADLESGLCTAVITDDVARRVFGTVEGVVGRSFSLNYVDYRVCGVVRQASYLMSNSYSQVYVPYSTASSYRALWYDELPYVGSYDLTFLVKDGEQADALRAEVQDIVRRENLIHAKEWKLEIWDQPTSHTDSVFQEYADDKFDVWAKVRQALLVLLVLLLVPALNLSGMIASRMEGRLPEMGVRKSFGAGRGTLLSQVMWENLLLTLLGGALGLVLAWLVLGVGREWVFGIFDSAQGSVPAGAVAYVPGESLFAPLVFLAALVLCVLLNMLSALVPAWHSLRNPIVNS
ncbi:MAG: ABC transporter permease, partial [Bacteroides sp.]|nr:ABC transporter permease [Bacteroides sp.]